MQHTVTLPSGNEIVYWTHNDGKKPALILVHGFTGSHEGFKYIVPLLSDFHLIIPDLPGFGISPLPHNRLTLRELGSLLVDFVTELDLEKPHLLGHSMGSLVVAEAVRQHPEIFAHKLLFVSPVPSAVGWVDKRRGGVTASTLYYIASHRLPFVGKKLARSRKVTRVSTNMILTAKDSEMRKTIHGHHFDNLNFISDIGWYRRFYREINRTGINRYRAALKQFDTLVITGGKDNVTPLRYQKKTAMRVGAKLSVIPGVGHLTHYEKPAELAAAITSFLR